MITAIPWTNIISNTLKLALFMFLKRGGCMCKENKDIKTKDGRM